MDSLSVEIREIGSQAIVPMRLWEVPGMVERLKQSIEHTLRRAGAIGDIEYTERYHPSYSLCLDRLDPSYNDQPHKHIYGTADSLGAGVERAL